MSQLIYVLNGPNLNLLGKREPDVYGVTTLKDIEARLHMLAAGRNVEISFRQSNHEGELIDWIHEAGEKEAAIILNAGAYTHTSLGLHDALKSVASDCVEVHLSNIFKRESFRHHSYISPASIGIISGFGPQSYELALLTLTGGVSV